MIKDVPSGLTGKYPDHCPETALTGETQLYFHEHLREWKVNAMEIRKTVWLEVDGHHAYECSHCKDERYLESN